MPKPIVVDTYSATEFAAIAGVTRRMVYNWIDTGQLPASRRGVKIWRIHRLAGEAFLNGRDPHKVMASLADGQASSPRVTPTEREAFVSGGAFPVSSEQVSSARRLPPPVYNQVVRYVSKEPTVGEILNGVKRPSAAKKGRRG
jgi:hypothetical protein